MYSYKTMDEHIPQIARAVESGADIIVGGDLSIQWARKTGVPYLFYGSTEESIGEAMRMAEVVATAIEIEKSSAARIEALMDNYTNGIIMLDINKNVTNINQFAAEMLDIDSASVVGKTIESLLPEIEEEGIDGLLDGRAEVYHTSVVVAEREIAIWAAPVKEVGRVIGISVTCASSNHTQALTRKTVKSMYMRGYTARGDLRRISGTSKQMRNVIEAARLYAMSQYPVLITGAAGSEKEAVAQGIHSVSARRGGPFVAVDCFGIDERRQELMLFGDESKKADEGGNGALEMANYGTLFLNDIDALGSAVQYRLFRSLTNRRISRDNVGSGLMLDVRLIASTSKDLAQEIQEGRFREDLFYFVNSLVLRLPPLKERPEDRWPLINDAIERSAERFHRQIALTEEARELLVKYDWPGNIIQIESFCERLVLTTPRQKVDASFIRSLLNTLYKEDKVHEVSGGANGGDNPEAVKISEMMKKYYGSRAKVAQELGVSTTTLWRKIKKYGISPGK